MNGTIAILIITYLLWMVVGFTLFAPADVNRKTVLQILFWPVTLIFLAVKFLPIWIFKVGVAAIAVPVYAILYLITGDRDYLYEIYEFIG